jgi:hypothetical protein
MEQELSRYAERVRQLTAELSAVKEENDQLRQASLTFGALADRLNTALRERRYHDAGELQNSRRAS